MKKFAKVMAVMLCAVLLVCGSVFGTLAYLTSQTGTLTNTFTIGDVGITLTEGFVGTDGKHKKNEHDVIERVMFGQGFKLIPGASYDKDPIIHVDEGSENAYLFVKVVNEIVPLEAGYEVADGGVSAGYPTIEKQMEANGWNPLYIDSNDNGELEASERVANVYFYGITDKVKGDLAVAKEDYNVFEKVYISSAIADFSNHDGVNYKGKTIAVTAYAIQAQGFDNLEGAPHAWEVASGVFTA
ncbi:MAG: hypothetical protein J6C23_02930 [Clostridia bacterium]|nr:hypothetical protein [Clostridia bacterium]